MFQVIFESDTLVSNVHHPDLAGELILLGYLAQFLIYKVNTSMTGSGLPSFHIAHLHGWLSFMDSSIPEVIFLLEDVIRDSQWTAYTTGEFLVQWS